LKLSLLSPVADVGHVQALADGINPLYGELNFGTNPPKGKGALILGFSEVHYFWNCSWPCDPK